MTGTCTMLGNALVLDFTGSLPQFKQLNKFDQQCEELIRKCAQEKRAVILIDRALPATLDVDAALVSDHLNLTGTSPLVGPNKPGGERFPVVQNIYIDDCLKSLPRIVLSGVRHGVSLNSKDQELLKGFAAPCASYNIVPCMLTAAHVKVRVLAIVVKDGAKLSDAVLAEIKTLTGGKA